MRILAMDDSPASNGRVTCVGVLSNGNNIEGVLIFHIKKDGSNATRQLIRSVKQSRFRSVIKLILTHGTTFGGLNILDPQAIEKELNIPWMGVVRKKSKGTIQKAIHAAHKSQRLIRRKRLFLENAGPILEECGMFFHFRGLREHEARAVMKQFRGFPNELRLAHLIASALSRGESYGRA
ncbi:DUF99 family protein [Candidatus Micrarchaeota archaeon]|nr:DUF99 family protein [Candidatus Micrarchaeota archaeon]